MKSTTPVQRAKQRLLEKIDEACIARGELFSAEQSYYAVEAAQRNCTRAERAAHRAITAYARSIRREERIR